MGLPDNVDVQVMFKNMTQALDMMRKHIDRTSFT